VNAEKTKYMVMSRDQNAGQNGNIQIGNKSFEQFTYLGRTLTNQNSIHAEIKSREIRECSVQNLLSSIHPHSIWNPTTHHYVHNTPTTNCLSHPEQARLHSTPLKPTYLRSTSILSPHLHLDVHRSLLPRGFPTKILYAFLFYAVFASCPAQFVFLDFIT
jgi:hypothetical protein